MTFHNQEIGPLNLVFCTMLSEDENILAAVNLINFLNTNQSSNTPKYWVYFFVKTIITSIAYTPICKDLNDPDRFKSLIDW